MAFLGLTDAMPGARAQAQREAAPIGKEEPKANNHTISGRCVNHADDSALGGISVRLYQLEGRTSPPIEIGRTVTDANGRYTFTGLVPPRPEDHLDRLIYRVIGLADDRPIGNSFMHFRGAEEVVEIRMAVEASTLSGIVVDVHARPVAGATVIQQSIDGWPIPGIPPAMTGVDGRFHIERVPVYKLRDGKEWSTSFAVHHPDHPETTGKVSALPADVVVTLPAGSAVTGTVKDGVSGEPAAGAVITARRVDEWGETFAATDGAGHFRLVVPEGRYNFLAEAKDRVCVAVTGRECLGGEKVELPAAQTHWRRIHRRPGHQHENRRAGLTL